MSDYRADNVVPRLHRKGGSVRLFLLALLCFACGIAAAALWFHSRGSQARKPVVATPGLDELRAVVQNLSSPVEIRFYSLLDPASVPETTRQFSERAQILLRAYEQAAAGKLKVTRFSDLQNDANAASADGLKPFNLEKGDACYLGMAIIHGQQKEVFRQLSPQWEPALAYDVCRAVAQVATAPPPPPSTTASRTIDPTVTAEVKSLIPNLESVPMEEAEKKLRLTAFEDFSRAVKQMEVERKAAEERLKTAQQANSKAEQQAAGENLRQLQFAQAEKLKEIAARSQAQIDALKQLKTGQK